MARRACRFLIRALAFMLCVVPLGAQGRSKPLLANCDPRTDFGYGSGCGSVTLSAFSVAPGGTLTVQVYVGSGCPHAPRKISVSNALQTVILDGTPVLGTMGGGVGYEFYWSPLPGANGGVIVDLPLDANVHTLVFTIDPAATPSCIVVDPMWATGPWVELTGNSWGNLWWIDKPFRIEAATTDLQVTKTQSAATTAPGLLETYTLGVANLGAVAATTAVLADTLPASMLFNSLTPPAGWACTTPAVGSTGTISCTIASFAAGASATATLVAKVAPGVTNGSTISNTAGISSQTGDTNSGNDTATVTATVNYSVPTVGNAGMALSALFLAGLALRSLGRRRGQTAA